MAFPSPTKTWHTTAYSSISPLRPELSAAGKVVLITGAGSGLGPHLAAAFGDAGAQKLALLGRTPSTLEATKKALESKHPGITVLTLAVDIASAAAVQSAFAATEAALGKIDVLVSNAGYLPTVAPIASAPLEEWAKGYSVNVLGALNLLQAFSAHKAAQSIVLNVSTVAVHVSPFAAMSGYSVSKTAAWQLFNYYQAENTDVRVISFHPGVLETAMVVKTKTVFVPDAFDDMSLPAAFAVWAASEEATFLKGSLVWSNWDVDELIERKVEFEGTGRFTLGLNGWPN